MQYRIAKYTVYHLVRGSNPRYIYAWSWPSFPPSPQNDSNNGNSGHFIQVTRAEDGMRDGGFGIQDSSGGVYVQYSGPDGIRYIIQRKHQESSRCNRAVAIPHALKRPLAHHCPTFPPMRMMPLLPCDTRGAA